LDDDFTLVGLYWHIGTDRRDVPIDTGWASCRLLIWQTEAPAFSPTENLMLRKLSFEAGASGMDALMARSVAKLCGAVHIEYGVQLALGYPPLPLQREHAKRWLPGIGALFIYLIPQTLLNDMATLKGKWKPL
jgi:hypothetical protein